LAEHFAQSTDPEGLGKALHYSELAAQRAMQVFAYGEAVRHLESALKIQDVLDPDDKLKRCDLLLELGEAVLPLGDPERVRLTICTEAFSLAEAPGKTANASAAALQGCEAITRSAGNAHPDFLDWASRAVRHSELGTKERVFADCYLALATLPRSRSDA